ncbi:hypothetical protein ACRE_021530 [Hapsidospora chrysogenum ATCC 11550]|uniref:2EXR domain-containing protein n=1 Tax=Hapsidospora chrysogenum (strain ATCC 11550 / CBS 779.69 / DSM 880 / IAM 14645 / JCM 23072 / IMI 49137) TaxID=857340 RepID=A0A086TCA5_HAPC1|nr:hypothetical protein ACRE_021530 [Hapsidospora chrysogenum ATCC 11550]
MTVAGGQAAPPPRALTPSTINLNRLPPELRLKIWSCAVEPRIVLFNDLIQNLKSYPLPIVTQLNAEARSETRRGYELVGRGSYFHFSRDILLCDYKLADQTSSSPAAEKLASRIERVVFWDCASEEERIKIPQRYSEYLATCYDQKSFGQVVFDRFWFPNVKDFWSVQIGDIDGSWMIPINKSAPFEVQLQQSAREFRYWVDENIIEIAPLDLSEPETLMVLREGRCEKGDCRKLNAGFTHIISKVSFIDGKYQQSTDGKDWARVVPCTGDRNEDANSRAVADRMRWAFVERSLTFCLRWDWPGDSEGNTRRQMSPA